MYYNAFVVQFIDFVCPHIKVIINYFQSCLDGSWQIIDWFSDIIVYFNSFMITLKRQFMITVFSSLGS